MDIRRVLDQYTVYQRRVEYLKFRLAELQAAIAAPSCAADYVRLTQHLTDLPHGTGTADPTAAAGIAIADGHQAAFVADAKAEYQRLSAELDHTTRLLALADMLINSLTAPDRQILRARYCENSTWYTIAISTNLSADTCKQRARKSIDKLSADCEEVAL